MAAPIDAVWPALNDLASVAPCLPGAKITGHEDGTYHGEFTLRVGPFAAVHKGTVRIVDADEAARVQRLSVGSASDNGSGAEIVSTLTETDGRDARRRHRRADGRRARSPSSSAAA